MFMKQRCKVGKMAFCQYFGCLKRADLLLAGLRRLFDAFIKRIWVQKTITASEAVVKTDLTVSVQAAIFPETKLRLFIINKVGKKI